MLFLCQEFPHHQRGVCRRIFMVQQSVSVLPHLRPFAPHIIPQSSQNLTAELSNIEDSMSSVFQDIFRHFRNNFRSCACGRSTRIFIIFHRFPDTLKLLNHSIVLAWLKACSPKASFSIRWVSGAVLLSLKQNLMQVLCSLTPAISINANTCDNGVKKTAKMQKHVQLRRSQLPDCCSKDTKRGTQRLKFVALTVCAVYSNYRKFLVGLRM